MARRDEPRTCAADGCTRVTYARGWCTMHHKRWQRTGTPDRAERPRTCSVDDCEREAKTRGWCHGHYQRWYRTGELDPGRPLTPARRCDVEGCSRRPHGHGLCRSHLARLRGGDLSEEIPIGSMPRPEVVELRSKGWITNGYRYVPVPADERHLTGDARYAAEHRLVMARLLGRSLRREENVHHRNGDRLDNRPQNLELWTTSQPSGQRVTDRVHHAAELLRRYRPELLVSWSPN